MVSKSHAKRRQDIKTKLMAAIAMLLVSSIMMVSSTYAWFTLSTAPEVTGISTQIGANGNLEMALIPLNGLDEEKGGGFVNDFGITSGTDDSSKDATIKNNTWGNIVDLGSTPAIKSYYGLDRIVLYPSALNASYVNGNPDALQTALLETPVYGVDGRISELVANTVTGTFVENDTNFPPSEQHGVRAVGAASGMTDRQIDYRNYRSSASTAMTQAKRAAGAALSERGSGLANIVLAHAADGAALHTQTDVDNLIGLCDSLIAEDGAFAYMEKAYRDYIIATVASAGNNADDNTTNALIGTLESKSTLNDVIAELDELNVTGFDTIKAKVALLNASKKTVTDAKAELVKLKKADDGSDRGDDITWKEITTAMGGLADTSAMLVNGKTAEQIKSDLGGFASSAMSGGVIVSMTTGGGVFADIADHCGDYEATIYINGNFNGVPLNDFPAKMKTESEVAAYLPAIGTTVTGLGAPASNGGQVMPISDFYGYVIDLAFRTNAASSNLLLQTAPVDRIYDDNHNPETMGGGSTMTFTSTSSDFTTEQMVGLMEAIRVVFYDTTTNNVYATAKLDMGKDGETPRYSVGTTDVTANLYLYEVTPAGTNTTYAEAKYPATHKWVDGEDGAAGNWVEANDGTATHVQVQVTESGSEDTPTYNYVLATGRPTHALVDGEYVEAKHVVNGDGYKEAEGEEIPTHAEVVTGEGDEATISYVAATHVEVVNDYAAGENFIITDKDNNTYASITELTQNQAKAVSVLVYLDGENITNADVAATAATSMTGSLNLQFSSSADLVPMEYGQLMMDEAERTEFNVSFVTTGITVTGNAKATKGTNYGFEVTLPNDCADWNDFANKYTVTVTIGDGTADDITDTVVLADGSGTIPGPDITGDIVITVEAKTANS